MDNLFVVDEIFENIVKQVFHDPPNPSAVCLNTDMIAGRIDNRVQCLLPEFL